MNILYKKQLATLVLAATFSGAAFAQKTKVKTITIVNGDTTVNKSVIDGDADLAKMEKEMNIVINSDDSAANKKIVKKIIIKGDGDDADAMAYAYSMGDSSDPDIDMTTGEDGSMNIVIKKSREGKSYDKTGTKKVIVNKSSKTVMSSTISGKTEKEMLNVNISVENTTAKINVQSGSKAPMNVSVLDENGKQVFYDSQKNGEHYSKEIKLEKKGTYFLNLIQDKKSTTNKIVVE